MKKILLVLFSLHLAVGVLAQKGIGVGVSGLYNIYTKLAGAGARVQIPIREKFYAVGFVYYYPSSGEFSGGAAAQYFFWSNKGIAAYAIASGSFSASVSVSATANGSQSEASGKKTAKAKGELGVGVLFGRKCWKPFIEPRYNILEKQVIARAGLMYFIGCGKGKNKGKGKSKGTKSKGKGTGKWPGSKPYPVCPAYGIIGYRL